MCIGVRLDSIRTKAASCGLRYRFMSCFSPRAS
jgi:hypothetical protein